MDDESPSQGLRTLLDVIYSGMSISGPHADCVGERDVYTNQYNWISYEEATSQMKLFASGLLSLGFEPGNQTKIGIFAVNSIQWVVAEYAAFHNSMVIVPIYDHVNPNDYNYIVTQSELTFRSLDMSSDEYPSPDTVYSCRFE